MTPTAAERPTVVPKKNSRQMPSYPAVWGESSQIKDKQTLLPAVSWRILEREGARGFLIDPFLERESLTGEISFVDRWRYPRYQTLKEVKRAK